MKRLKNIVLAIGAIVLSLLSCEDGFAQKYPERGTARRSNKAYEKGDFAAAEIGYRKALEQNNALYEANFNLGNALYRQQRFADAAKVFGNIAADTLRTDNEKAEALFNMGNSYFGERKFEEAIETYKSSLRLNPDDQECKFNLAYAQKMLQHQQNQQNQEQEQQDDQDKQENQENQENQDNKDNQENKDNQDQQNQQDDRDQQNKDQEGDDNKEDDENNKDSQNQPQEQPQNQPQDSPKESAPQPRMSQQEAEQLLQAIQGEEDKTRDKMDSQRAIAVGRSGKNW